MDDSTQGLMSRLGSWFKRGPRPENGQLLDPGVGFGESRNSLLRPFAKRDHAIANLQQGFLTLTDLMVAIKDNLNDQGRRQDELLGYLSHLPQALQSIPESNRLQGETLRAIHGRLEQQSDQQQMIADILSKVSETGADHRKATEHVREHVESMAEHDRHISDNLSSVGAAMQTVSRNSVASAQVLEQLRDNIVNRDGQLERVLSKQATRFTILLSVAIFLSILALAAVAVVGYRIWGK